MNYDSAFSTAVFLGPTLTREEAANILAANYYPPVKMGDVYKLISSGVETILIIDGVFHATSPVWQREILSALNNGIKVIGASSMGALRAAELHVYGMVGVGRIFEWYRDGVIDGDDEVALLHADATLGFHGATEPLVNIRFNLERAQQRGTICDKQRLALIDSAKRHCFHERTYRALFESTTFQELPQATQMELQRFLTEDRADLKRDDAILTLQQCRQQSTAQPDILCTPTAEPTDYQAMGVGMRGVLSEDTRLITIREILSKPHAHTTLEQTKQLIAGTAFVYHWLDDHPVDPPAQWTVDYIAAWISKHAIKDLPQWLCRNGLTQSEFDETLKQMADASYLCDKLVKSTNTAFAEYRSVIEAVLATTHANTITGDSMKRKLLLEQDRMELLFDAAEAFYVVAWAKERAIDCPPEVVDQHLANWEQEQGIKYREQWLQQMSLEECTYLRVWHERALYHWIIDQGPAAFGYSEHLTDYYAARRLQVTGQVAELAAMFVKDPS